MSPQASVASPTLQQTTDPLGPQTWSGSRPGFTASMPVLPGEDPAVFQAQLDALLLSVQPQNQIEYDLTHQMVTTSMSLARAQRAESAAVRDHLRNGAIEKEQNEKEEAVRIGQRLLWDGRGAWQSFPHAPAPSFRSKWEKGISWSSDPEDGINPTLDLLRLERTIAGCTWLLDRWAGLRSRLVPGDLWLPSDQFVAIRLLGKQPLDAIDDRNVLLICLASAKLSPDGNADPFAGIKRELRDDPTDRKTDERLGYIQALKCRPLAQLQPKDADSAREALRALVDRECKRVKEILERHRQHAAASAADEVDRLALDPGPEGEKRRRYMLSLKRLQFQALKTFLPLMRSRPAVPSVAESSRVPEGPVQRSEPVSPAEVAKRNEAMPSDFAALADRVVRGSLDLGSLIVPGARLGGVVPAGEGSRKRPRLEPRKSRKNQRGRGK